MKGMDRYFSFGIRKNWMDLFFQDEGLADFWMSDGHGLVANKKKDAFLNFVKDAGLVEYDKTLDGDKYTKNIRPGGKFCVSVFRQSQECVREALALRAGPLPCQNPTASCLVCAP